MIKGLVTGGSRGIGREIVKEFAKRGYTTYFLYKSSDELARELEVQTGAIGIKCDVTVKEQVSHAFEQIRKDGKGIDILVNNAGISEIVPFLDIKDHAWHNMMAVTLDGAYYCSKEGLTDMLVNKWGRIINISSMWGQTGASCEVHYSTAKAGLIGMTKALALEFAPSGITVNCIAPGIIDTDMNREIEKGALDEFVSSLPMERMGKAYEVASLAGFLSSEESGYITGQVFGVNGGAVT